MKDMDDQLIQCTIQSKNLFGIPGQGNSQLQNLMKIFQQYEYIKSKVQCKPEYLKQFIQNYQDIFGFVNQSVGFNYKSMSDEMKNQNNKRMQAEFNKLEQLKKAILLGFQKQILVLMENKQQNQEVMTVLGQITDQINKQNQDIIDKNDEQKESIQLHSFINDTTLKEHIKNHSKSQPAIIVTTRSQLLSNSLLEYLNDQNNIKFLRLEGIVCLCSQNKIETTKTQLQLCPIPLRFTTRQDQVTQDVFDLINKNQFLRIISLEDFSFYIQNKTVNYLSDKVNDLYKKNITLYSFKQQNYQDVLKQLANYIEINQIPIYKENYNAKSINYICQHLQQGVFNTQNEQQLAQNFVYFYTMESSFYKLVNSCLNILNEGLLSIIEPIILPLLLALKKAKSQEQSEFVKTKDQYVTLYRGTTIPQGQKDILSKNKQLVFPAFSSFTTSLKVAQQFMRNTKSDEGSIKVLLIAKYKKDSNPDQNPKYLKLLSAVPSEEEYLIPPFTLFRVNDSKKEQDYYQVFLDN